MTVAAFLTFVLKVAPTILSIIEKILSAAHDQQMIKQGELQSLADASSRLNAIIAKAAAATQAQAQKEAGDSTDAAFPKDIWRD